MIPVHQLAAGPDAFSPNLTRPSRSEKQEIGKGNQMTALRSHTGGTIKHVLPPFGGLMIRCSTNVHTLEKAYTYIQNIGVAGNRGGGLDK